MAIKIIEVKNKNDVKKFVNFQFILYKDHKCLVPPMKSAEINALFPSYNPSMQLCNTKIWMAKKDGELAGRMRGIIHPDFIKKSGEEIACYTRFDSIDDFELTNELLLNAENLAKEKKMDSIDGPLGFTYPDHQGLLIEVFEHLPLIASKYRKTYYKKYIEAFGHEKEMDWVEFRITIPEEIPERTIKVADTIQEKSGMFVKMFSLKKILLPYAKPLFKLMNDAFYDLFSFVPLNDRLIEYYFKKFIPVPSLSK